MKEKILPKYLQYWLPVIIYCFFIFMVSEKGGGIYIPPLPFMDKIFHVALYAILGALYSRAHNWQWGKGTFISTIMFTLFYGLSDEFHQFFVPERVPSVFDVIADGIGGVIGFYVFSFIVIEFNQVTNGPEQNSNY